MHHATTKGVFSCTDDNMTETHLYLDPPMIATLQVLHRELRSRLRRMITYGSPILKEANERYKHLYAEATQAMTNIQLLEAAGMEIRLPTTFGDKDLGGENPMYIMSQNPKIRKQIEDSLTNPDNFMDTDGQPPIGVATTNHLGEENTQIADDLNLGIKPPTGQYGPIL